MADTTITLTGAAGVSTVTPRFDFTSGTVKVYIDSTYEEDLTSGAEANIALAVGEVIEYVASDWDSITRIDISGDKVSGDISGLVLPTNLVYLHFYNTSVSGDISGLAWPNNLQEIKIYNTSVFGDVSGYIWPNSLLIINFASTSVSGDISGYIWPNSIEDVNFYNTSISGDVSVLAWPNNLETISFVSTLIDYDSSTGGFEDVTDNLTKIDFDDCNLTEGQVDNVLTDLVTSGITDGVSPKTLDIGGNNAAPSNAGTANIATLISRGWTVTGYGVIRLTGAAGVTAVTPLFNFPSGTIKVYIDGAYEEDLTSTVEANITLGVGEVIEYVASDWDSITRIDFDSDKVSGDISGWVLPDSLSSFYVHLTSVSGDISGWILPNSLRYFYVYSTSLSGDISGWTLPSSLMYLYLQFTSLSGDISGWSLSNSLEKLYVYNTSIDYDSATGAFEDVTNNLIKIDFDDCSLGWQDVDNVLADCVASGITDGVSPKTLEIGGNNSPPTAVGLVNKDTLVTRGWTVIVTAGEITPIILEVYANDTITPEFTFSSGTVHYSIAEGALVEMTSGVAPNIVVTTGQKVVYICSDWDAITKIEMYDDQVSGDIGSWVLPTGLIVLDLGRTRVSGDIGGWAIPSSIIDITIDVWTNVSGDISGWVLPSGMEEIHLQANGSIVGDIGAGWTIPTSMTDLRLEGTGVSGDISGWIFPAMEDMYLTDTNLSGDISGWTIPASLDHIVLSGTNVTGDVSLLTLHGNIIDFEFSGVTGIEYGAGGALIVITKSTIEVKFDDCGFSYQEVDQVLADLAASGVSNGDLEIDGTSSGNSPAGAADRTLLDITRSWHIVINAEVTPPTKASSPSPADLAVDVAVDVILSWTKDGGDTVFVYLDKKGENDPPITKVVDDVDQFLYDPPGDLVANTIYVWRVDTKTGVGTEVGDQWEFTTIAVGVDSVLSYNRGLRGIGFGINRGVV